MRQHDPCGPTEGEILAIAEANGLSRRKVEDLYRVFTGGRPKVVSLQPGAFVKIMSGMGIDDTEILHRTGSPARPRPCAPNAEPGLC